MWWKWKACRKQLVSSCTLTHDTPPLYLFLTPNLRQCWSLNVTISGMYHAAAMSCSYCDSAARPTWTELLCMSWTVDCILAGRENTFNKTYLWFRCINFVSSTESESNNVTSLEYSFDGFAGWSIGDGPCMYNNGVIVKELKDKISLFPLLFYLY